MNTMLKKTSKSFLCMSIILLTLCSSKREQIKVGHVYEEEICSENNKQMPCCGIIGEFNYFIGDVNWWNLEKLTNWKDCEYFKKYNCSYEIDIQRLPSEKMKTDTVSFFTIDKFFNENKVVRECFFDINVNKQIYYLFEGNRLIASIDCNTTFYDRAYYCNFSDNGRYFTIQSKFIDMYNSDYENIIVFDLKKGTKNVIDLGRYVRAIPIKDCLYYSVLEDKENDLGVDLVENMLYKRDKDGKNELFAKDADLVDISPDGKFMLIMKVAFEKIRPMVINIEERKGFFIPEKYLCFDNFYSGISYDDYFFFDVQKNMFAYNYGKSILYIPLDNECNYDPLETLQDISTSEIHQTED
ncbi:MAG: hypothetical protein U0L67_07625 [Paludibacteraceae bacterium]|nr:hypothetical protein [Paludibacteraceae bacterium]